MDYQVYFSDAGVPKTGLTPSWASFQNALTAAALSSPGITEIGGGWYGFSYTPANPVVGVIDGGLSLANADRYKPVAISPGVATAFGSIQVTIVLTDALSTVPIPDVEVVILNSDETLLVNSALTNSNGRMVAQLNAGGYVVRLRKDGYNFATPQTIVVTGPAPMEFAYTATSVGDVAADSRTIVVPRSLNSLEDL